MPQITEQTEGLGSQTQETCLQSPVGNKHPTDKADIIKTFIFTPAFVCKHLSKEMLEPPDSSTVISHQVSGGQTNLNPELWEEGLGERRCSTVPPHSGQADNRQPCSASPLQPPAPRRLLPGLRTLLDSPATPTCQPGLAKPRAQTRLPIPRPHSQVL